MSNTVKRMPASYFEADTFKKTDVDKNEAILSVYEGPVQKKTRNKNSRVYSEEFWTNFFNNEQEQAKLEKKQMFGKLCHPEDDIEIDYSEISHSVVDLWDGAESEELDDDIIYGRIEIFNTEPGKHLNTLLEAGVQFGVSSRALVYSEEKEGVEFITDGEMFGWDFVSDPSVEEAQNIARVEKTGHKLNYSQEPEKVIEEMKQTEQEDVKTILEAINQNDKERKSAMGLKEVLEENEEVREEVNKIVDERNDMKEEKEALESKADSLEERLEEKTKVRVSQLQEARKCYQEMKGISEEALKDARDEYQGLKSRSIEALEEAREEYWGLYSRAKNVAEALKDKINSERKDHKKDLHEAKDCYQELKKEKEALEGSFKSGLEEARKCYQEMKKELGEKHESKAVDMYAKYTLASLGLEGDKRIEKYVFSSETLDEINVKRRKIEEGYQKIDGGLPVELEEEIKVEINEETSATEKRIQNLVDGQLGR